MLQPDSLGRKTVERNEMLPVAPLRCAPEIISCREAPLTKTRETIMCHCSRTWSVVENRDVYATRDTRGNMMEMDRVAREGEEVRTAFSR